MDGSSSYYCIVLDNESSLLTTFNTHRGKFHFVHLPFELPCSPDIFQRMMDQILDCCEGVIGKYMISSYMVRMIQNITADYTSSWRLQENMEWYWTRRSVKSRAVLSSSLVVFMTSIELSQIHQRSVSSRRCLPHRTKESFRASLEW